jgi:hypothetical protein
MVDYGACIAQGPPSRFKVVVDEVEVPHREVGANRRFGKIERSADASQGGHALIHSPFEKHYVKPQQETARQFVLHVAIQYWLYAIFRACNESLLSRRGVPKQRIKSTGFAQ